VSYKNISRILKVKYPEGTVERAYGETYKPGVPELGNGLFCGQHAINISQDGYIYMYDNNSCNVTELPKVLMLEEPRPEKEGLKKVWEYDCTDGDLGKREKRKDDFLSGGNVVELPDHSIFVCMSGVYSKLFIVSPEKKILWAALPEYWNKSEERWFPQTEYRASIIVNRADIERLIWNADVRPSRPQ
jgi:hypothetical protein